MNNYQKFSDEQLIELLKASDHGAYTEIHRRYWSLVFVHAVKKLQDEDLAEDFVQEVFIKLWTKRESSLTATNVPGYLYTLLMNRILDFYGHERTKAKYAAVVRLFMSSYSGARTDALIREKELNAQIDKEIAALPRKMREIFILNRKQHLSYKDIAEALNTNENNVSKQVNTALKRLRDRLGILVCLFFSFLFLVVPLIRYTIF